MRYFLFALFLLVPLNGFADTPANVEPNIESLTDLINPNRISEMTIHNLSGRKSDPPHLHGYQMLNQKAVESSSDRTMILQEIDYEVSHPCAGVTLCFAPRQASPCSG